MPPLPGAYNATFVVGATTVGFDIRTNGYSSTVEGNRNVQPIPWSGGYSVVIQRGGLNPHTRRYRVLAYTEADYIAVALLVNNGGTLTTPREPAVLANLDSVSRGDAVDQNNPNGLTTFELVFTPLA